MWQKVPDQISTKIVIIRAGYAGMMTGIRLAGRTRRLRHITITLINGNENFIERPRLHEVATGVHVPQYPIKAMVKGTGVQFIKGWVTSLRPQHNAITAQTDDGLQDLTYDYLVYALGSSIHKPIEGIDEHAYILHPYGENGVAAMHVALKNLEKRARRVVVVGGGATGIEGAVHIKSLYPHLDVTIVSRDRFASFRGPRVERHIRNSFELYPYSFLASFQQ